MANYSTAIIHNMLGAVGLDTGADGVRGQLANGVLLLYEGTLPTNADNAVNGTLLGIVTKNGGAFVAGSPTNGLNFASPVGRILSKTGDAWKFTALATGTIGYGRFICNAGDDGLASTTLPRIDLTVGLNTGDIRMDTLNVTNGAEYTLSGCQLHWQKATAFSSGLCQRMLGKVGDDANANGFRGVFTNCAIRLLSGVEPVGGPDAAQTGTLLGVISVDGLPFIHGSPDNGLNFAAPVGKTITKNTDSWKFYGLANGVIGYYRVVGNAADSGSASTSLPRVQGTAGIQNGTLRLDNLVATLDAPGSVGGFTLIGT